MIGFSDSETRLSYRAFTPGLRALAAALLVSSWLPDLAAEEVWLRIDTSGASALAARSPDAIDYDGFVWMPASDAPATVSGDGVVRVVDPFAMRIGDRLVDPARLPADAGPWYGGESSAGSDFRLVQFRGPIQRKWLAALAEAGIEPVQYLHPFAYVVWADAAAMRRAEELPAVRWTGAFAPAQRAPAALDPAGITGGRSMALLRADDAVRARAAIVAAGVEAGPPRRLNDRFAVIEIEAGPARYRSLASLPGVFAVQPIAPDGGPRGEMAAQSIVGGYEPDVDGPGGLAGPVVFPGYDLWLEALGLDGSGVIVSIIDGGVRDTHRDLVGRMVPCLGSRGSCGSSDDDHGTHVAGAVAGRPLLRALPGATDATGFLRGQGVAPGAELVEQLYGPFLDSGSGSAGGMAVDGMLDLFADASDSGAALANNSWGPAGTPRGYDIPTMQVDMIVRDADPATPGAQSVLPVWSVMNGFGDAAGPCAPSSLGSPDEAKNLLAVGSTGLRAPTGGQRFEIFDLSANSAHGPACDGRRVPHLVAPGCFTDSTLGQSDSAYGLFCGTSMASPVVAGAAALFVQQYRAARGATPSPALTKAVFTAAARDLAGYRDADGAALGHRPDRKQGWGRIELAAVVDPSRALATVDQSFVLRATGQGWRWSVLPEDPAHPVRIMLAWTDAPGPGTGGATPAWVNDLDLDVDVAGSRYRGNAFDPVTGWSLAGGAPDPRNNLEGVMLSPAQHRGETLEIRVLAANLAADALDPWNPAPAETRQDFALACFNCVAETVFGDGFESP